jgi:hypothetical protein
MPRRLKIPTAEMGEIELFVISVTPEGWGEWEDVRESPFGKLISVVPFSAYDHALRGWSKPLVTALGLPPEGALRKMPTLAKQCGLRRDCIFYKKAKCHPFSKKMPWCYEPQGVGAAPHSTEILSMWREGVYVIAVLESPNG